MNVIELSEVAQYMVESKFHVARINFKFDIEPYIKLTDQALREHPPQVKDGQPLYKALGLQYGDESNPFYDAVQQLRFIPADKANSYIGRDGGRDPSVMHRLNEVGHKFVAVYNLLFPFFFLTRMRLVVAEAGFVQKEHTDGSCCTTVHFPIRTNPQSILYIEGKPYHLPADGGLYLVNAGVPHHAENLGTSPRIHLTVPLSPTFLREMTQDQYAKAEPFRAQFGLTRDSFHRTKILDDADL